MKIIAVTYEQENIFQHFGHTQQFKLYKVEDGKIMATEIVATNGSGHGALADFLREQHVDVLLCGGIGAGAKNALAAACIELYAGCSGSCDAAVEMFLNKTLTYDNQTVCSHHSHEDHACGGHEGGCHHGKC